MPTFVKLAILGDGTLEYQGMQSGPGKIPRAPVGMIYREIPFSLYSEICNRPVILGKEYRATLRFSLSKAAGVQAGTREVTRLDHFDQVDIPPS